MPAICRERWLLLMASAEKREGQPDHTQAIAALRAHVRLCPDCLSFIHSFPADGPAYPVHDLAPDLEPVDQTTPYP